ncbi:MAG: ATP-binding cassette domain-containing protein [Verrucomicrobiales bacterium]
MQQEGDSDDSRTPPRDTSPQALPRDKLRGYRNLFIPGRTSLLSRLRKRYLHRRTDPVSGTNTLLPLLIKVFGGFSRVDGRLVEHDIDSSLGFLRYDYPETVYSELRRLYREALEQPQNLNEMAQELAKELSIEEKILLGVQLYVLISRADLQKDQLITFYLFMTNLGIASQAIDIVYQLNTSELETGVLPQRTETATQPLEGLVIAREPPGDVIFDSLAEGHRLAAFRFQNLILLKNIGAETIIARGRRLRGGEFCRIYEGQRALLGEMVLDFQSLVFYFNAKKDVSSTRLYLSFGVGEKPYIEKSRSKQSFLEIKFGLGIHVAALRDTRATIKGTRLQKGTSIEVSLQDNIVFRDKTEIAFSELRRRARELGGKFDLLPTKSEYLVSNNPNLLRTGDILLSPGASGEILLRIRCDYGRKTGELEVLASDRPITVQDYTVRYRASLRDGDTISIGDSQFLLCDFSERIIEEQRNIIRRLELSDISHAYGYGERREAALESVSLSVLRGEMICVMGPSGCGKSTLLRALAGQLLPDQGEILFNGISLYENLPNHTPYISFIPQEDAFDPLLTVQENIDFASALRAPHFAPSERKRRADSKLVELGLNERRHRLAGDPSNKNLSGGERKRLNIGMDMIGVADIYLFDEPTSGLSSKDSEHLMEIIRGLSHNKIIFVSIHQPSAKLFNMFQKALLLDHGGKLAFFGAPEGMLAYFEEAQTQESVHSVPADQEAFHDDADRRQPDFIFDILETPLRDLSGDIIYEEDEHGHLVPARRFSPSFWRDRFAAHRLIEEVSEPGIAEEPQEESGAPQGPPQPPLRSLKDEWTHLSTLVKRSFLSKLRNRANLATTLLEAPALAILVSLVLRYSEDGEYNFASAFHIPTYLFLTLVIAMFLGLTNSADEIIRERVILQRERNQGIRASYYILAKLITVGFFGFLQCVIYLLIGDAILSIRDMFFINLFWMFSTLFVSVIVGLNISVVVNSAKTALNIIPLILIPNIILGGALIKYEEMNRDFDIIYYVQRLFRPVQDDEDRGSDLKVPPFCQFMPLRWAYESTVIAHARQNPVSRLQLELEFRIKAIARHETLTPEQEKELRQAKEALTLAFGIGGASPGKVLSQIREIRRSLEQGIFDPENFYPEEDAPFSAETLYLNGKILDLVNIAEAERTDYRYAKEAPDALPDEVFPNVFFGTRKRYFGIAAGTLYFNALMMGVFTIVGLIPLHYGLRRQITKV